MKFFIPLLLIPLFLAGCAGALVNSPYRQVDQLPMYGGLDRNSIPELKKADEDFIAGVSAAMGSREAAAKRFVDQGFAYCDKNNYDYAMRRLNQAWLLDPRNPEVYWGFSAVLHDQKNIPRAYAMARRAYDLAWRDSSFLADLGRLSVLRIVDAQDLTEDQKSAYIAESESYYQEAVKPGDRLGYIYDSWASAKYWAGDYAEAWKLLRKAEANGGTPSARFFALLGKKMPEPETPSIKVNTSVVGSSSTPQSGVYITPPSPDNSGSSQSR